MTWAFVTPFGCTWLWLINKKLMAQPCGWEDSVMDSHTTGAGFKTRLVRYFLPSSQLITITASSWAFTGVFGRSGEDFPVDDIKMGSYVFQCNVSHQWIAQRQVSPISVYRDGVGIMSCVWGMAFLCGSALVKVLLLQAGTVMIWPQMFKSDFKSKQTKLKYWRFVVD